MKRLLLRKLKYNKLFTNFIFKDNLLIVENNVGEKQNIKLFEVNKTSFGRFLYFLGDFTINVVQLNFLLKSIRWTLKGFNQVFFFEFKIVGLGYKVFKLKSFFNNKIICFRIGLSHRIKYYIPNNIGIVLGKKRFLLYSSNFEILKMISRHFFLLKKLSSYKEKGIIDIKRNYFYKKGKQQQH